MARSVAGSPGREVAALFLATMSLSFFGGMNAASASEYEAEEPGPVGTLRVARPTLTWKVLAVGDTKITETTLTLNGNPVPAAYVPAKQSVVYTPDEPLAPGAYTAKCTVMLDGEWPVRKSWRFSIAPSAPVDVSAPDAGQKSALAVANAYRRSLGLPPLRLDPRLCAAAAAHSAYLERNRVIGHDQEPGRPGFLAARPAERRSLFGYAGGCFENIDQGSGTIDRAVRGLFDAPYHRVAFLQPGSPDFGVGMAGDRTTMEVGTTDEAAVVVYPADGQQGVPTYWNGNELPDPLRVHLARGPVGYAITFFYFSPEGRGVRVTQAQILDGKGASIPFYLNTSTNDDHLKNGAFLIPRQPLRPGVAYRVAVTAATETGEDVSRTWRFTTTSDRALVASHLPPVVPSDLPYPPPLPDNPANLPKRRVTAERRVASDKKPRRFHIQREEENAPEEVLVA